MNSKLKIAIFHLAFIYSGGGEKLVLEEAKGLKKLGHDVSIFTPVIDEKRCFPDVIKDFKIKTFLPTLPSIFPEHESFQILLTCVLIPFLAHRFRGFDVILAANQPSPWLAFWVKKLYGVPCIAYLAQPTRFLYPRKVDQETGLIFAGRLPFSPATYLMNLAKPLISWADKVSVKGADLVLANGEYMRAVLERTYGVKVVSCPAGAYPSGKPRIYADRLKGTLKVVDKKIQKPFLLITNRHFPQKRFEYAISSLPALLADYPDLSLAITGEETAYARELKILVKQLSLNGKVLFLGLVSEKDLTTLYQNCAVYLYTAPEEDFGMGIVEAMAQGAPVVAWDSAGPSKIIKDGKTGLLAKPFEIADYADKIARVLADKKIGEKLGKQAWEDVRANFAYENHIRILESILSEVARQ